MVQILEFIPAVIGFLLAGGVWIRSVKKAEEAAAEKKELETKIAKVETRNKQAEAKAHAMTTRARDLEKKLAEAVARRDEKAMASVMWSLELERSYRQWRDVIVPDPTSSRPNDVNIGQQLAFAISQEVERLREEVGVSIRIDTDLSLDFEPETALGALRISEELLALAAKAADEVLVHVTQPADKEPAISVVVDCVGWDTEDDPTVSELSATVQGMAMKLDGWVQWSREADGRLIITVYLPAVPVLIDIPPSRAAAKAETATN